MEIRKTRKGTASFSLKLFIRGKRQREQDRGKDGRLAKGGGGGGGGGWCKGEGRGGGGGGRGGVGGGGGGGWGGGVARSEEWRSTELRRADTKRPEEGSRKKKKPHIMDGGRPNSWSEGKTTEHVNPRKTCL